MPLPTVAGEPVELVAPLVAAEVELPAAGVELPAAGVELPAAGEEEPAALMHEVEVPGETLDIPDFPVAPVLSTTVIPIVVGAVILVGQLKESPEIGPYC